MSFQVLAKSFAEDSHAGAETIGICESPRKASVSGLSTSATLLSSPFSLQIRGFAPGKCTGLNVVKQKFSSIPSNHLIPSNIEFFQQ
jgi:hypothetical protein